MNIGNYTFNEFRQLAENFHGYAAPGLLVGGYMVEKARKAWMPKRCQRGPNYMHGFLKRNQNGSRTAQGLKPKLKMPEIPFA